jgi:hypothetical protein
MFLETGRLQPAYLPLQQQKRSHRDAIAIFLFKRARPSPMPSVATGRNWNLAPYGTGGLNPVTPAKSKALSMPWTARCRKLEI